MIKDKYESNDKATLGMSKETDTHKAIKHGWDKPIFEFCIVIDLLWGPE